MMDSRREFYGKINEEFKRTADAHQLWGKEVACEIVAKGFVRKPPRGPKAKTEQYFKMPSEEYALTKGKEVLLRCKFNDSYGDAFTDEPKIFRGKLSDVGGAIFGKASERAVYFATLNAMFGSLGRINGGVHCKEKDPERCGMRLADYIVQNFGKNAVVTHIGYQPGHVAACSNFKGYVTDLNLENIGKIKFGKKILSGGKNEDVIRKSDVASITGSTIVNGSLFQLLEWCKIHGTEPIVYGVTVSVAAKILKLRHCCPYARSEP